MIERFKGRLYMWGVPQYSYESWTRWQMFVAVLTVFTIFLLSPTWIFEVARRVFGMIKCKLQGDTLDKFFKEELERELELDRRLNDEESNLD